MFFSEFLSLNSPCLIVFNPKKKMSSHFFHSFLRDRKIGGPSSAIPDEIGRFRSGVPHADDLVQIPDMENFPLEEAEKAEHISEDDLRGLFARAQIESIHADPEKNNMAANDVVGSVLEIPGEFESVEDYVQFKRELATVYKKRSDEFGWNESVGVCCEPLCFNSTPPGFRFCLFHSNKEDKYDSLGLIGKCQVKVDDHDCPIPCGIGHQKCAFHRNLRETSK